MGSQICARSSERLLATVPCSMFICRTCRAPIKLPDDALKQRFLGLAAQLNNVFPVALVCVVCKRVDVFSSQLGSPYYDPNWRHITSLQDGKTEWLSTLLCKGDENEFRVPLLVTWTADFTVQEKMDRTNTWHGDNMLCPGGHPIFWPWSR